jgi:hypothetical protein
MYSAGHARLQHIPLETHMRNHTQVSIAASASHVYVALRSSRGIAVFARDVSTGLLTVQESKGYWTAWANANAWGRPTDITASSYPLLGLSAIALSTDTNTLYAVNMLDDTLVVFGINAATGALSSPRQIIKDDEQFAGRDVDGLRGAAGLSLTSDSIYVAGWGDKAVSVFGRDGAGAVTRFVDRVKNGERLFDTFAQHNIAYDEVIDEALITAANPEYDVSSMHSKRAGTCTYMLSYV